MEGRILHQRIGLLGERIALFGLSADVDQAHARLLDPAHAAHIRIAHDAKLAQIFRLAVHIRTAVDQKEKVLAIGQQRRQRRAVNALDAAQTEHAARQHSAGRAGRNKAVCRLIAHGKHALDHGAVLHLAHCHDRRIVIGDYLGGMLKRNALLHIVTVAQQRLDLLQIARQRNFQFFICAQRFNSAFHSTIGRIVAAHGVQINVDHAIAAFVFE